MPELLKEGDKVIIVSQPKSITINMVGKVGIVTVVIEPHLPYGVDVPELKLENWYFDRENLALINSNQGCKVKQQAA